MFMSSVRNKIFTVIYIDCHFRVTITHFISFISGMSLNITNIPKPTHDLRYFSSFIDWALWPIDQRLAYLGIKSTGEVLFATGLPLLSALSWRLRGSSESSSCNPAVELTTIKLAVSEVGWLTWNEYLYLVVADHSGGFEGFGTLVALVSDPDELQDKVNFLSFLLEQEVLTPFKSVLEKVIQRFLLEVEMKKKYPAAVGKRYRDFWESGRSMDFGWEELEEENKVIEEINTPRHVDGETGNI